MINQKHSFAKVFKGKLVNVTSETTLSLSDKLIEAFSYINITTFAEFSVTECEDLYQFPPVNPWAVQSKLRTNDTAITDDRIHSFAGNNYDSYHNKEMLEKLMTQCEFVKAVDKLPDNIVCLESWLIHIKTAKLENIVSLVYSLKLKFVPESNTV